MLQLKPNSELQEIQNQLGTPNDRRFWLCAIKLKHRLNKFVGFALDIETTVKKYNEMFKTLKWFKWLALSFHSIKTLLMMQLRYSQI